MLGHKLNRENRKGIFKIIASLTDDYILPQVLKRLEFIPLDVRVFKGEKSLTMMGTSHYFDELGKHGHIPEYELIVTESDGGQLKQLEVIKRG